LWTVAALVEDALVGIVVVAVSGQDEPPGAAAAAVRGRRWAPPSVGTKPIVRWSRSTSRQTEALMP